MSTENYTLLFLTGSINPDGMSFTKLQDPVVRKKQYIEAINFYLQKTTNPILFVENTGTDISPEFKREIEAGRLEILTWQGNIYKKDLGKGYGEMMIIEYGLLNSYLIKRAEFIFKITGRYKVLNIKKYLKRANYKNIDVLITLYKSFSFSDSRFWGSTYSFLSDFLIKYKDRINDSNGYFFEHALYDAAQDAVKNNYNHFSLPLLPRYSGVYGTENTALHLPWILWYLKNLKHQLLYKS